MAARSPTVHRQQSRGTGASGNQAATDDGSRAKRRAHSSTPFVTVLPLNWNGNRLLPACLRALAATDYPKDRWETVVVDNASTDGSLEGAMTEFSWIRVRRNPANWGFAKGYNDAIADAPGEYVALLNLDTRVRPGWLRALVAAAEAGATIGAATAKLIFPVESPNAGRIQNAGGMVLRNGSGRDRGTRVEHGQAVHEDDRGQYDRLEEVFFFCGAGVLLRKAALADVGLFDERYFMYYEDLDLSWRLRLRGWKVVYVPNAVIEHEHAASSGEWSPLFTYSVERNRPLMLLKLAPLPLALQETGHYLADFVLNCARVGWWATTRRQRGPHAARAKLQAKVIASWARDLPGVLVDRLMIQRGRRVPESYITAWMVEDA
ncbi:MAG: glycosyltransferase family 2 protein [Chloroflexi bacterium]|nr:glycosyltransferase family 2 protein [Chloroflexota bacterium]